MLNHDRKSRLEIAFRAGGQHLQTLVKGVGSSLDVGHVSSDVRITRISEHCDRVDFREKLMQQLHTFRSPNTRRNAHTREVAFGSTETFDKTHFDRVGTSHEDNGVVLVAAFAANADGRSGA